MEILEPTDRAPPTADAERKTIQFSFSDSSPEPNAKTPEDLLSELQACQLEREAQSAALDAARLALEEARDQYRGFHEFAPVGCLVLTRETLIVEVNITGAEILGIGREQLLDSPFRHWVAPADLDPWDRYFSNVLHYGDKRRCELQLERADGSRFPARLLGHRLETRGGTTRVRIALDDISERRHLEAALHQNEDTLNALTAHIAVLDANGQIVLVNEAWQRFAARNGGLDYRIGIGNDYLAVCRHAIAQDRDATAQAALDGISAVLDGTRRDFSLEYSCDSPTVQRWFSMRAHPLGRPRCGAVIVHEDITARKRIEAVLRWNEQRIKLALHSARSGTWEWDIGTQATRWSTETYWMLGLEPGSLTPSRSTWLNAVHPEDRDRARTRVAEAIKRGEDLDLEYRVVWPDGGVHWLYERGQLVLDENGRPARMMGLLMDVTDRKRAEDALRASEARYRATITALSEGVILFDPDESVLACNPAAERLIGLTEAQMRARRKHFSDWHTVREEGGPFPADELPVARTLASGIPQHGVILGNLNPAGKLTWLLVNAEPVLDEATGKRVAIVASFTDITERKRAEEALRASLAEKTVLLHEVHHRVKNNLAAIIDLLELQRESVPDTSASAQLTELSHRIHTMALVHKMLYQSGSLSRVDCHGYLQALIAHLRDSLDPHSTIRLRVAVPGIEMDLDTAIPCGLIVNELVTNAFRHAFPASYPQLRSGAREIVIAMDRDAAAYTLAIADNGVGLPVGLDWTTTRTLGLRLVRMLGQHQLRGQIELDGANGTRFSLRFAARRGEGADRHEEE